MFVIQCHTAIKVFVTMPELLTLKASYKIGSLPALKQLLLDMRIKSNVFCFMTHEVTETTTHVKG